MVSFSTIGIVNTVLFYRVPNGLLCTTEMPSDLGERHSGITHSLQSWNIMQRYVAL